MSNAIQFLASVAERPGYKHLFEDPATLGSICEKVIVPNMEFRGEYMLWRHCVATPRKNTINHNAYVLCISVADEETFEDNPEEYIRRDVEGSGEMLEPLKLMFCYS